MTSLFRRLALASALTLGIVGAASAHAHLQASAPAIGGTVAAAPTEIDLSFSEGVNPKFTGVKLTGPGAAIVPTGHAVLGREGDRTLVVPVTGPLVPGLYRVDWHALATDGHKTDGSYTFTLIP